MNPNLDTYAIRELASQALELTDDGQFVLTACVGFVLDHDEDAEWTDDNERLVLTEAIRLVATELMPYATPAEFDRLHRILKDEYAPIDHAR